MSNINFINTIVFVRDIEKSKKFYSEVLGQKITRDFGAIVFFENHFVIHERKSIFRTVFKRKFSGKALPGKNNILIYFESDELNATYERVKACGTGIIHGIEKQQWGQMVFRFYDPDNHIVEVGEPLEE